ncbi:unnamed protein product, partial [Rotaria socialis]
MDWSSNSIYQSNNPNQIIRNMARELEESTVGPLKNSLLLQTNKQTSHHDPMPWLPTPPHLNQSSIINGNYSFQSPDYNCSNSNLKRNQLSTGIDESYHLFQAYEQPIQNDNLQKPMIIDKQHCMTPVQYSMNSIQQTPSYQQHSLPSLDLHTSSSSSFGKDSSALYLTKTNKY